MTQFKRKRQIRSKADAILTADWHIRPDKPICRTDNFLDAMERKIDFIFALTKEHNCPILEAGDIGHKPQWPNWLLEWFISKIDEQKIICIPGQHDLPNHRIDLFEKSGMGVLHAANAIKTIFEPILIDDTFGIFPFPYGKEIEPHKSKGSPAIAMTHQMVIENKPLWPGQEAPKGSALLKKHPEYNLILSGDNHNSFTIEHEGMLLVNPGSMMRTNADQESHKPRVYLWWAETNTIEAVYLPIEQGVISRTHIEVAKDRENRNQAFIQRVNSLEGVEIDYEDNLAIYFKKYKTEIAIRNKTMEAVH